jgi:pimeloyl-ACP methyl ester carboxylesterase
MISGGPGGSGIGLALAIGKILQQVVDAPHNLTSGAPSSSGKYYDIIGFDPRGVNNTTPAANCFPDDSSLSIWLQRADAQGFPYSNETFANSWSRHASFAGSCTWRLGDDDDNEVMGIGRYLNTPSVVEDMRAIVGALGEWRESEAKRQADLQNVQLTAEVREATRWRRGEEKLLYMGFSYGTLLGATFAAMHPDKVGRVVLDAVVDAEDYYSGRSSLFTKRLELIDAARWMKNLQDADSILETFFRECHLAGKEKCAISSPTDPEHPKRVYYGVLEALKEAPMIVPGHDDIPPNILTYHDLMQAVVSATYNPYPLFRPLANILHGLSLTNGTLLSEAKRAAIPVVCQSPTCKQHPWSMQCQDPGLVCLPHCIFPTHTNGRLE